MFECFWVRGWNKPSQEQIEEGATGGFVGDMRTLFRFRVKGAIENLKRRGANFVQVQVIPSDPNAVRTIKGNPCKVILDIRAGADKA